MLRLFDIFVMGSQYLENSSLRLHEAWHELVGGTNFAALEQLACLLSGPTVSLSDSHDQLHSGFPVPFEKQTAHPILNSNLQ